MSNDTMISVEGVSKLYRLGQVGTGTLSHDLNRWWHRMRGKDDPYKKLGQANNRAERGDSEYVWALRDINFELKQGEVLGIIGRNGAGKSTLLKLLSKVTAPTEGIIKYNGRIASLLEVGTGFHPELTGRENIFLNGSILGMTKKEIRRKFDEIVDFSGVERYIDTPVKRYSSGMYVRLAFAVAAFLEPEILIVDEVLAVGDYEFQDKCLGRMKDVSNEGRTVLFVSHNMAAVRQLCQKGIVLRNGMIDFAGDQANAIDFYQNHYQLNDSFLHDGPIETAPGNEFVRVLKFELRPLTGNTINIYSGFEFELQFFNNKVNINLDANFELRSADGHIMFNDLCGVSSDKDSKTGIYTVKGQIPPNFLNAGKYSFWVSLRENKRYKLYKIPDFVQFEIENVSDRPPYGIRLGQLVPEIPYTTSFDAHM